MESHIFIPDPIIKIIYSYTNKMVHMKAFVKKFLSYQSSPYQSKNEDEIQRIATEITEDCEKIIHRDCWKESYMGNKLIHITSMSIIIDKIYKCNIHSDYNRDCQINSLSNYSIGNILYKHFNFPPFLDKDSIVSYVLNISPINICEQLAEAFNNDIDRN